MESIWLNGIKKPVFKPLSSNISTDVVIIGGGITGIICAHMLKCSGVKYALIEAKSICSGVTECTTAKVTVQHGLIFDKMLKRFGYERTRLYISANEEAAKKYSELCAEINCDYEIKDSYVYSLSSKDKIKKEVKALNSLGINASEVSKTELPFEVAGAVKIPNQAQLHPLKFAYALAKDLNIYENTKALELLQGRVITNGGEITCKKIIVATHFPIINKHGGFFLKMYQHRSYVIALKNAQALNGMYVDEDKKGLSFRAYGDLLLLGGGSHRTGKKGGNWQELERFALEHYKNAEIVGKWATQDCMTLDGIPYIGKYSASTPNLYVATGFNKWGMTSAMTSAMLLCDMVQGKENKYEAVFNPSRGILRPQLAINTLESFLGLITPTTPRCPHLGCALKYNPYEHSWDCPCHGSRFDKHGALINNPATDDKKGI